MAAATITNPRRLYLGPVAVIACRVASTGTTDTFDTPILAQSSTKHRAFAITSSPLNDQSTSSSLVQNAVVAGGLQLAVAGGGSGDANSLRIFTW